jgi:hypothetical protein
MFETDSAELHSAAKHLFRHLHDARALRLNPLVRRCFESPTRAGDEATDSMGLGGVHRLVQQGAEYCRSADRAAGREEQAFRHHAIVTHHALGRQSIVEVARDLGLSLRHCYRERSEIYFRVARYIAEFDDAPALEYLAELDDFRLLADRALHRAACSDRDAAVRACDDLISAAASPQQKVEALYTTASVSIGLGEVVQAEKAYIAARRLCDALSLAPSQSRDVAEACLALMESDLAAYRGESAIAAACATSALQRLEPHHASAGTRVKELHAADLYKLGAARYNLGDLEGAYDAIARADASLSRIPAASLRLRTRTTVALWRLRSQLLTNAGIWYPAEQRVNGLASAFEQAYTAGFLGEAVLAMLALTEHHACSRNDDEAVRAGRVAIAIAKQQPSRRLQAQAFVQVATMLLLTAKWEVGTSLIRDATAIGSCDAFHRALLSSFFAVERAFREHAYDDAWTLASVPHDGREYTALTIRRRLIAAAAAHKTERSRDAHAIIEATMPTVEQLKSAPILRDACSVAASVTGDARFERRAREFSRLLIA